jgi:DNA-binding GntR family transcriptional regulator
MTIGGDPIGDRPPLREAVAERIRELIIEGELRPGERLIETTLAEQLRVSRGPIREAMQMLTRDGWVDQTPRRGTYVHIPTKKEVDDFFTVRRLLEGYAAATAAERGLTEEQFAFLRRTLDEAKLALDDDDARRITEINGVFHSSITKIADNDVLTSMTRWLSSRNRWFFSPLVKVMSDRAWKEHNLILDAIADGDVERARRTAEDHVAGAHATYLELSEERKVLAPTEDPEA